MTSDPINSAVLLLAVGLLPFAVMMCSSFVKIVVVTNLLRNALGVQQIPPTMALNGLALILSVYVMAPVIEDTYVLVKNSKIALNQLEHPSEAATTEKKASSLDQMIEAIKVGQGPIKNFLKKHASPKECGFFYRSASLLWGPERAKDLDKESFFVLVPSFMVSELTSAFQIGFLLYLPFIAIDLVVSNILMAMGMMMVSPMTISLPFKLVFFIMLDGWSKLLQGLVLTYL